MAQWTTRTQANARPEQVLEVLTDPDAIRLWSPIDFDVEDLDGVRLDVEVHAADEYGVELTAHGPIGIDVRYELGGGITGRLISQATAALLSAGALDGAARSIARAAEGPAFAAA
jgi:hypothetical protein